VHGSDRVELWDAEDFDPRETLRWKTVRVLFYRQQKPDGEIIEAFWLSDSPIAEVSSRVLYHLPRAGGRSKINGLTMPKTATTSNISAIIIATAC